MYEMKQYLNASSLRDWNLYVGAINMIVVSHKIRNWKEYSYGIEYKWYMW